MKRSSRLGWCAISLYLIAWFLPVLSDGRTLADGVLPGWEAVTHAVSIEVEGYENSPLLTALIRATPWTNVAFVAAAIVILLRRPSPRMLRYSAVALAIASALNIHWLLLAVAGGDLSALRPGYYTWLVAFPLLAVAAWQRKNERA